MSTKKARKRSKVIITRIPSVEPYRKKVVDFTELYAGNLDHIQTVLRRKELVVPDEGVLLCSAKHSKREGKDVYFLIKWMPAKGIKLAFALVHEGFMVKKAVETKSKNSWKHRYFRLWRRVAAGCAYTEPVLQYYKTIDAKKPNGELRLHKSSSVEFHNMGLSGKTGYGLHLKMCGKINERKKRATKSLFAYTETETGIRRWIKAIKRELAMYQYDGKVGKRASNATSSRKKNRKKSAGSGGKDNLAINAGYEALKANIPAICLPDSFKNTGPGRPVAIELPPTFRYDQRVHKAMDFTIGCSGSIRELIRMVSEGEISLPRDTGLIAQSKNMSERLSRPVYYHMHFSDKRGNAAHECFRRNEFPERYNSSSHFAADFGSGGSHSSTGFRSGDSHSSFHFLSGDSHSSNHFPSGGGYSSSRFRNGESPPTATFRSSGSHGSATFRSGDNQLAPSVDCHFSGHIPLQNEQQQINGRSRIRSSTVPAYSSSSPHVPIARYDGDGTHSGAGFHSGDQHPLYVDSHFRRRAESTGTAPGTHSNSGSNHSSAHYARGDSHSGAHFEDRLPLSAGNHFSGHMPPQNEQQRMNNGSRDVHRSSAPPYPSGGTAEVHAMTYGNQNPPHLPDARYSQQQRPPTHDFSNAHGDHRISHDFHATHHD